jgi:carbon storage regulator CsrA
MLVLTRKEQEEISIGEDIKLVIVSCNNGRVRIGIQAPQQMRILRSEIEKKDINNGK